MNTTYLTAAVAALLAGCLEPLVSDAPGDVRLILPAGSNVPSILDSAELSAQLSDADGLAGTLVRQTAFANGALVHAWNFGPAPGVAAPLFVLASRDASGELVRIAHPNVIEAIPGDPRYSPFWAVYFVEITPAYQGELLTSFAAVSEAVSRGLVRSPAAQTFAVDCPIAGPDVRVDVGSGQTLAAPSIFYYEGMTVPYFDLGRMPLDAGSSVPEARRIVIRREGDEPLSEIARNVDVTGDGDTSDTNDVLEGPPGVMPVTPRLRTVAVAVADTTALIDTSRDEAVSDVTSLTQLFAPGPTTLVVGFQPTDEVANWVVQVTSGGL